MQRELTVRNGDVILAGSLWRPMRAPGAVVLMHPGSGPSDRDNDVFFPPIREHLLEAGIAVASFDKRGVGESTGRWQEAAIEDQAADALACLDAVQAAVPEVPVGLFGHSQGGWVVVEAAARSPDAAFVISSSGPGVSPGEQERYATRKYMREAGLPEADVDEVVRYYDRVLAMMRAGTPLGDARIVLDEEGFPPAFEKLSLPVLPESDAEWKLMAALIDYDPRPALERIAVPVLALFGAEDPITPVEDSVAVFRDAVPPALLQVEVFAGADHRLRRGDDALLVDGYLETMSSFIVKAAHAQRVAR
jgi:uncharacterized protein